MTGDEFSFATGLVGALILVAGAAYPPETVSHPAKSVKNWLFAIGGCCMLAYSLLHYVAGGPIFFVILQLFIGFTSVLMMPNTTDTFDTPVIIVVGIGMIAWSLSLFEGMRTVFFVIGLSGTGLGYAMDMGTFRREAALATGSGLIAFFSYIENNMVFFWLNLFFALFSTYYAIELLVREKRRR